MSRRFWSELAANLEPYVPGEQPQHERLLKLNTNESPFPPSPRVREAIASVSDQDLLRYPDPGSEKLRRMMASFYGVDSAQIFVGNGSDEVLSHVFAGLLKHDGELLFPDITYSFYPVWCQLHGIRYREVPLRDDFRIVAEDYATDAPAVIFPNPNAPTGSLQSLSEIRDFLDRAPDRLIVVDEAYIDFGGESAVSLIDQYDNLLIVQTLSKSRALAGLRIGLAIGSEALIEALTRVKDSFNSYPLDVVAQRAAVASFEDEAWFRDNCRCLIETRETLAANLRVRGFEVLPSAGNFLFVRHETLSGLALFNALRERGVILRRWNKPRIENYLRVSIGTPAQCERLLSEIDAVL